MFCQFYYSPPALLRSAPRRPFSSAVHTDRSAPAVLRSPARCQAGPCSGRWLWLPVGRGAPAGRAPGAAAPAGCARGSAARYGRHATGGAGAGSDSAVQTLSGYRSRAGMRAASRGRRDTLLALRWSRSAGSWWCASASGSLRIGFHGGGCRLLRPTTYSGSLTLLLLFQTSLFFNVDVMLISDVQYKRMYWRGNATPVLDRLSMKIALPSRAVDLCP